MYNKEQKRDFSDVEYRFSFALTINDVESKTDDIIICKRDFNIYNLDEEALYSIELKECIDDVVTMIDMDLKSKSRVYAWYNRTGNHCLRNISDYGTEYVSSEFSTPLPEKTQTMLKFVLYDNNRPIITKGWSADVYPFAVRNSIDLTNRKYKYENVKNIEMDFAKQIAQKGAAGRPDLLSIIMRHISSTCASYSSRQSNKKLMYKQYIPDLSIENVCINQETNVISNINNRLDSIKVVADDNGYEKTVYEVYNTKYVVGDKEYDLTPKAEIEW